MLNDILLPKKKKGKNHIFSQNNRNANLQICINVNASTEFDVHHNYAQQ